MTNAGHLWRDSAVSVQILRGRAVCGGVNITNLLAGFIKLLWLAGGLFGSLIDPTFAFLSSIFLDVVKELEFLHWQDVIR